MEKVIRLVVARAIIKWTIKGDTQKLYSPVFELGLLLLLVFSRLLGVLLLPRELEVESGMSSEGSSQP